MSAIDRLFEEPTPERPRRILLIAEAGVNHNGDVELARRLVESAARAGADAIKFQTFSAERLASADAPKADYQAETTGGDEGQLEMLRRLELPAAAHRELEELCQARGLIFLSTPFDEASADLLDELQVAAFKVGSGDLTNLPLLRHVGAKGRPVLLSTGMAELAEVDQAVEALDVAGCRRLALLHCVSCYPTEPADVNLRAVDTLRERYGKPVGFSDHTLGIEIALAAAARGAALLEKHLTLDRGMSGPDHRASLEHDEWRRLAAGVRAIEAALGDGRKRPAAAELRVRRVARKSVAAAVELAEGAILTRASLCCLRPETGIAPAAIEELVGRRTRRRIARGSLLSWEDLA